MAPTRSLWLLLSVNVAAIVALLVVLFTVQSSASTTRIGAVSGETLVAQSRATYLDTVATAAKRRQALLAVPTQNKIDTTQASQRRRQATIFFSRLQNVVTSNRPLVQKLAVIQQLLPRGVSATSLQQLPNLTLQDFRVVQTYTLSLLDQAITWRFDRSQLPTTQMALLAAVPPKVTPIQRTAIGEVLAAFLTPTLVTDRPATQRAQKQAVARVAPIYTTIPPGELIVRRGDLITPSVMEKLTALGLQSRSTSWRDVFASLLFSLAVVGILFWYLYVFHADVVSGPRLLFLVDAIILMVVAAARIITTGHVLLPFFLPVAATSTFAAVLIAPEACFAIAIATAVLAGWVVANSFELTLYYFLSSAAGILAIQRVRQLKRFILAGVHIAVFAFATALAFVLVDRNYDFAALQQYVLASAFNGFVSASLAIGGFALLSDFFGVTTTLRLLELGQPDQRLLRRLMTKAPGTYNHSLIVATMVERAAEEIGAHSLVAKVGALYHDVGKTTNPHAFVENQLGIGNIHDQLRPDESARIIRGHVGQGLRLARQHKLPRVILDAIAEHHGTMTIAYFLHKARQQGTEADGDAVVDVSLYSYPGPKPHSKETTLLMLADGCESTVRAAQDHSRQKIEELVRQIFEDRVRQGQLDESPMTIHDLEQARSAFCSVLHGLYHPRIEYPEPAELSYESVPAVSHEG